MLPSPKRLFILICLFSLLFAVPLYAQEDEAEETAVNSNGISLNARVGFDGLHKGAGWRPVQVTVANEGAAVTGRLLVDTNSFNGPTYAVPIDLPTQSNKRVSFSIYDDTLQSGIVIRLENENNETVAAIEVDNLRSLDVDDSILYGVVSPRPDSLELLEKIYSGRSDAAVAFLSISDLPEDRVAWRDLDLLVFNDVDSNQLSAEQRDALTFWVSQGGQLIVTGGASWQKTTAAFTDLLPVTISGSESVADLPALAEDTGEPFRDPGPYVIATSTLREGELLYHQDGLPILARRPVGRGGVYFLAIDPQFAPLDDWDGSQVLWGEVSRHLLRQPFWEQTFGDEGEASRAAESLPELTLPSTLLIMGFMLVYIIVIGPANYLVLRRLNRRELGWVTIPASIVLFSILAFIIGLQFKGNLPIVNQMNLITGRAGQTDSYVQSAIGIYSPGRTSYEVVLDDDVLVRPLNAYSSALNENNLNIIRDGRIRLPDTIIDVGGVGTMHVSSVRPLPNITGQVVLVEEDGQSHLEIMVTNQSDFTLENAIILVGDNKIIQLNDLEPGETETHQESLFASDRATFLVTSNGLPPTYTKIDTEVNYASPLDSYYYALLGTTSYYSEPAAYARYQLLEGLYNSYATDFVWQPATTVSLVGWSSEPLLNISLENVRHDNTATTLYFLELPYTK